MPTNDASYDVLDLEARAYAQTATDLGIALDGTVPFSVDAWVRLDGLCSGASILSKEGVFTFGISGNALVLSIAGYPPVQSNPQKQALDHLEWHYVTATYADGQVRLYIDGQFNVLQAMSGSGGSSASPFQIGKGLQAHVRSVRVYKTALDAEAVMNNMFEAPGSGTIVANFDFSQTPPVDSGPGHLSIALEAGARMTRSTPSLALSGTALAEPLSEGDEVNPGGEQVDPYTVQAWVYVADGSTPEQAIFVNSELESETGMALYLEYSEAASGFHVVSQRGSSMGADSLTSTTVVGVGVWTNVATTFDGTKLRIYIDGREAGSGRFGPVPLGSEAGRLLIGAALSQEQPFGAMTLKGYISRLEVWDVMLTPTQIRAYMAAMPEMSAAGLTACYDFTTPSQSSNLNDAHPVGLAEGANLTEQVQPATSPGPAPTTRGQPQWPAELDESTIRSLCDSIDLREMLREADLEAAMAADVSAFGDDPEAQEQMRQAWREAIEGVHGGPASARFLVTSHVVGDEHVVLCHRRGRTHVAFRIGVDDIDACTLWKVKLVFIVVAGVFDALFGLTANLSDQAIKYIEKEVLRQPSIAILLASGRAMTARGIFGLAVALFSYGFLKELLTMVAKLGFWALIRVGAKMALKRASFIGATVDVLASLAATAAAFIVEYTLGKPASCTALPTVDISGIKFYYDSTATATDALRIRRNYSAPVPAVQWTKGMSKAEESQAAYAISRVTGKTVTLQASFVVTGNVSSVLVKAEGGGILGAIDPFPVNVAAGRSSPQFVTIPLSHHTLASGGIQRKDVEWEWSYQLPGGSWTALGKTSHRIYVLLDTPTGPWQQPPSAADKQLPWTDVLDFACEWAGGKASAAAAAVAITEKVNGGIGLRYDTAAGASRYTATTGPGPESVFLCTHFVDFLRGGGGQGPVVNCTDCATIVTAFANSVGCNLLASKMYAYQPPNQPPVAFGCNMIQAIGSSTWAFPFGTTSGGFSYHEVAWTGAGSYPDPLYDACLKLDGGNDPWTWTHPTDPSHAPILPLGMPFTTREPDPALPIATPFTDQAYRERLATNQAAGIGACKPRGPSIYAQSGRRKVI